MDNVKLNSAILDKLEFLITIYGYSIFKNGPHWTGGLLIEYKKENYIISILYDKSERWFVNKLYSFSEQNKTHLYLVEELRTVCPSLPSPSVLLKNETDVLRFLSVYSECLKSNLSIVKDNFEKGIYYGGKL